MKVERVQNASRNILFGLLMKGYQILMPFLMRTALIYYMGIQYLGLNSLFTSVLQVLNLAELGVGNAMVYSMYKPVAENDSLKICALMKLYRTYYYVVGLVIAIVGMILTPFVPKLISGDIPEGVNLYILYLLNLSATVLSYWLFAYKNSVLIAHQRMDITSKVTIVTNSIQYILQFLVLLLLKNYYVYVLVVLVTQVLTNVATAVVSDRMFPQYKPVGKLPDAQKIVINQRIKDLFTSKLGAVILNSADTIVISSFLGLTVLAIYQNYYFILTSIIGFVAIIFSSVTAGIGNSIITETKDKNFCDFKKFTFLISWLSAFCSCCFLCLFQPFMKAWVGEEYQLGFGAVICFSIYFYIYEINQLMNTFKDAAGIWHEDRFRPLTTALVNLVMNLFFVRSWGIYGVLLSTVFSWVFVGMPWLLHNLFTALFDRGLLFDYLKSLLIYLFAAVAVSVFCTILCNLILLNDYLTFVLRLLLCVVVFNTLYLLIFRKNKEFLSSVVLVDKMTKGKLHLSRLFIRD